MSRSRINWVVSNNLTCALLIKHKHKHLLLLLLLLLLLYTNQSSRLSGVARGRPGWVRPILNLSMHHKNAVIDREKRALNTQAQGNKS